MLANGDITSSQYANAVAKRHLRLKAGRLYSRIREPYFFSYVREELQKQYGANTVRVGRPARSTRRSIRVCRRFALDAIKRTLPYSSDPAAAIVSINPQQRRDPCDDRDQPGEPEEPGQLRVVRTAPAGLDVQDDRADDCDLAGHHPVDDQYLSAPFKYDPTETGSCDTNPPTAWCPRDVRPLLSRPDVDRERATLRSDNTVYARLSLDVGPENIADMAYRLGVQHRPARRATARTCRRWASARGW